MNTDIANILKDKLTGLTFVDRITGLVRPVVKIDMVEDDIGNESRVRKVFPVGCEVTAQQCAEESTYKTLVPDSDRTTIIYFEDRGVTFKGISGKTLTYTSRLRLVCWINLQRFNTTSCTLSALVSASIIKELPWVFENHLNTYQKVMVKGVDEVVKTSDIFSQYTYSEETNQYLLYPYDYFALDIETDFSINENCIGDIETCEVQCMPTPSTSSATNAEITQCGIEELFIVSGAIDGFNTVFEWNKAPKLVFVQNSKMVRNRAISGYTLVGKTITLSEPPQASDSIEGYK